MSSYPKLLTISALFLLLLLFSFPWVSASSEENATLAISQAEETFASAYEAVLEAEEAGANVSGLLSRLNFGGEYLADAYAYVRLGDSESAGRFAGLCVEAVDDVEGEAVLLRDEAERLEKADLLVRVFGSAVGVVIVVVSSFVLWVVFKRRYHEKVLGLRPEVNDSES